MIIKRVQEYDEIFEIMNDLKNSFFSDEAKNNSFIINQAEKYSKNAIVYCSYDKQVNGFISFYANDVDIKIGFLSMIIISKDFQGNGIGKHLMDKMLKDLRKLQFDYVDLEVNKSNEIAIKFYEKYGFYRLEKTTESSFFYRLKV